MPFQITNSQFLIAACALILVAVIGLAAYLEHRKGRTRILRKRFGPEYDRAVIEHGSSRRAEAKLIERESRVRALEIREVTATERERFVSEWQTVQSRFLDHPRAAVIEADDLVNAVLEARGYPRSSFEQRAGDLSVNYPRITENLRHAHAVAVRPNGPDATTEELRAAMIQYRAIFDELVQSRKSSEHLTAA